jgi:hypothetical protein
MLLLLLLQLHALLLLLPLLLDPLKHGQARPCLCG